MAKRRSFVFAFGGVVAAAAMSVASGIGSGASTGVAAADTRSWPAFLESLGAKPSQAPSASDQNRRESVVADCMTKKGLPYTPIDWERVNAQIAEARKLLPKTEAEWLQRYGYGVTASIDKSMPSSKIDDPNVAVVAAMGADDKVAYGRARGECSAAAEAAVPSASGTVIPADVASDIAAVHAAALRDPRVVNATDGWSQCLAARGFRYPNQAAIVADLQQRTSSLRNADVAVSGVPPGLQGQLDSARSLEMAVAAADAACRPPLESVIADVTAEHESAYLAANGDRIADAIVRGRG